MPPRPLHRWKSFWFGVLVIAFLGWAWFDSTRWSTMLRSYQFSISNAGSGICLADWKWSYSRTSWQRQQILRSDETWGRIRFEAPEIFRSTGQLRQLAYYVRDPQAAKFEPRNPAARHFGGMLTSQVPRALALYLPHWFLILLFLVPWSGFLIWRWWRTRRGDGVKHSYW